MLSNQNQVKDFIFRMWKDFFFLYLGSSSWLFSIVNIDEKALKMFVAKVFRPKIVSLTHESYIALWFEREKRKKKTWVFLWHLVKIRDDLDSAEIRKKKNRLM